jgi:hypothetical protein
VSIPSCLACEMTNHFNSEHNLTKSIKLQMHLIKLQMLLPYVLLLEIYPTEIFVRMRNGIYMLFYAKTLETAKN